jgi:nitrogen regulatory protein PII
MKRIEAVISPWTLDTFKDAALALGISEFDIIEIYRSSCTTIDRQQRLYRGHAFAAGLVSRLKVEFVLLDDDLQTTLHQLLEWVHPESIGIFKLEQTIRPANGDPRRLLPVRPKASYPVEAPLRQAGDLVPPNENKDSDDFSAIALRQATKEDDRTRDRR